MTTLTATIEEITNVDTGELESLFEDEDVEVSKPRVVAPALAMAGACLGVLAIGGAIERRSPWAGINAATTGLGLSGKRPPAGFDIVRSLAGIGTVVGGMFVVANVARRVGGGRIGRGIAASALSLGIDALFMRRNVFSAFTRTLGLGGTIAKYAAIGVAAALAR